MANLIRKTKAPNQNCPHCQAIMEPDVMTMAPLKPETYIMLYECPNGCKLDWNISYQTIEDPTKTFIYYEEDDENV